MAINYVELVKEFIETYPRIQDILHIDYIENTSGTYGLMPNGQTLIRKEEDVLGDIIYYKQYNFILYSTNMTIDDVARLENINFLDDFTDWIKTSEKPILGIKPDEEIWTVQNGMLMEINPDKNTGTYQIQINIEFCTDQETPTSFELILQKVSTEIESKLFGKLDNKKVDKVEGSRLISEEEIVALGNKIEDVKVNGNSLPILDKTIDISIPTQYGYTVDTQFDGMTGIFTVILKDKSGNILSSSSKDLPLELIVVSGRYENEKIILTLINGDVIEIPVGALTTEINNHITNKANPHNVTKTQVGLGNVTNDKQATEVQLNKLLSGELVVGKAKDIDEKEPYELSRIMSNDVTASEYNEIRNGFAKVEEIGSQTVVNRIKDLGEIFTTKTPIKYIEGNPTVVVDNKLVISQPKQIISKSNNLFDGIWEEGSYASTGVTIIDEVRIRSVSFTPIKPNTTYSLNNVVDYVLYYDSEKNLIERFAVGKKSFTSITNAYYIRITFIKEGLGSSYPDNVNVSLNEGTTALPYQPFAEHTIDLTLPAGMEHGLVKLPNGVSDKWTPSGVEKNCGYRAFQDGDINSSDMLTDGTNTIYQLATPEFIPAPYTDNIPTYTGGTITVDNSRITLDKLYKHNCVANNQYFVRCKLTDFTNAKITNGTQDIIFTNGYAKFTANTSGEYWIEYVQDGINKIAEAQWLDITAMANTTKTADELYQMYGYDFYDFGLTDLVPTKLISTGDNWLNPNDTYHKVIGGIGYKYIGAKSVTTKFYNASKEEISNTTALTFTTPNNCCFITLETTDVNVALYHASNPETEYKKYEEDIIDFPAFEGGSLPNGVRNTPEWNNVGKVMLNGSEGWVYESGLLKTNTIVFTLKIENMQISYNKNIINDFFTIGSNTDADNKDEELMSIFAIQRLVIRISKSRLIDYGFVDSNYTTYIPAFKSWLQANNVTIRYQLATPIPNTVTAYVKQYIANNYGREMLDKPAYIETKYYLDMKSQVRTLSEIVQKLLRKESI